MVILDALGRKIMTKNLSKTRDEVLIDVNSLNKGVYSISFIVNGNVVSTQKLTIVK
jgi:hypothetical protein